MFLNYFFIGLLQVMFVKGKWWQLQTIYSEDDFPSYCSHFCAKWIQVAIVFAKAQSGKGLEQWTSINGSLTDSCLNAAVNACLAAYWLISWMIVMLQHLEICEVANEPL